jgi:hypothetical protein
MSSNSNAPPRSTTNALKKLVIDCNLSPGYTDERPSRTRGGGKGRPNFELLRKSKLISCDDSSSSSLEVEQVLVQEGVAVVVAEEEEAVVTKFVKPLHTRVIVEVKALDNAFAQFACPKCYRRPLEVSLKTVCIATHLILKCNNSSCGWIFNKDPPAPTTVHVADNDNYERTTDYALNVLYVVGFMSMGDGHSEAGRLLGLLGLPNDTTMESRSFSIVESRIGPLIRQLCEEILVENVIEEARLSMEENETQDHLDFEAWQRSLTDPTMVLPQSKMPKVEASYDMAWQQKVSGHQYNSKSGHGTLMGRLTRKVIGLSIKSKICTQCNANAKNKKILPMDVPVYHRCWKNHDGSSGSMEAAACLELVVEAFNKRNVVVARLCCDDDSSVRADCQWSNQVYMTNYDTDVLPQVPKKTGKNKGMLQPRPDKGKLPANVPEPKFVADPNHRRKGLTGELIKLDTARVQERMTMTRMDSTRIGKNFGYMARTLRNKDESEYLTVAKAVVEHHFDCHDYCGDWCRRKNETELQRQSSKKYYRCKVKSPKLYALICSKVERFITIDKLIEMAHGLDTNMNEAFNQICTWFAPKNKVFAGSGSLHNRIALAVGINSIGVHMFFKRLFIKLGIEIDANVEHYLKVKEGNRMKRLAKVRTREGKKNRNKSKHEKLKADTVMAKTEHHKREGTYRKGMNIDDPYGELLQGRDEEEVAVDVLSGLLQEATQKPRAKKRKTPSGDVCEYCGKKGHLTKRSKVCTAGLSSQKKFRKDGSLLLSPPVIVPSASETTVLPEICVVVQDDSSSEDLMMLARAPEQDDADDMDQMDAFPLDDDDDAPAAAYSDSEMEYHDAGTWSSDEEDSVSEEAGIINGFL